MAFPTVTVTPGVGQTINTLPNAGQATSGNSLPVVIASDQSSISVSAAQSTAANLNATVVGTGTFATQVTSLPALPAGTNAIGSITNTSFAATQATASSLNATVVQGTAANLNASVVQSGTWSVSLNNSTSTIGYLTNPSTIYSAQQSVTTSATALTAQALSNGIVITAKSTNTGTTYVGPSTLTTANGYALLPGKSISYGVTNANAVWIIGTGGDTVYVTGN